MFRVQIDRIHVDRTNSIKVLAVKFHERIMRQVI